ncbi:MAG: molybdenum cofactor guanylyltransferase [Armatimonadota bacterium]
MTGLILAGGQSTRLGTPKALLRLGGQTFIERVVAAARTLCEQMIVVVSGPEYALPAMDGCRVVEDETPGLGPLGGLATGLTASEDEWHLTLACDLPLLRPELLGLLVESAADADAIVPNAGGRLQPLLAVYSRSCLAPARASIEAGRRAMSAMLDQVRVKVIEEAQLRAADPELASFTNVNTWDDYQTLVRREELQAQG